MECVVNPFETFKAATLCNMQLPSLKCSFTPRLHDLKGKLRRIKLLKFKD